MRLWGLLPAGISGIVPKEQRGVTAAVTRRSFCDKSEVRGSGEWEEPQRAKEGNHREGFLRNCLYQEFCADFGQLDGFGVTDLCLDEAAELFVIYLSSELIPHI